MIIAKINPINPNLLFPLLSFWTTENIMAIIEKRGVKKTIMLGEKSVIALKIPNMKEVIPKLSLSFLNILIFPLFYISTS